MESAAPASSAHSLVQPLRTPSAERLLQIYKENADKLYMPKDRNYPFNHTRADAWAESHCDPEYKEIARLIVRHTLYISWGEYIARLEAVCLSARDFIVKRQPQAVVMTIFSDTVTKSNFWVALLCMKWLGNLVTDVGYSLGEIRKTYAGRSVVCLVPDDASYSGRQLLGSLDLNETPTNLYVAVLTAYMSNIAAGKMSQLEHVHVSRQMRIWKGFFSLVEPWTVDGSAYDGLFPDKTKADRFVYHMDISAIYFDHKLADGVSTFQKVYGLAPLYGCNDYKFSSFIDGCEALTMSAEETKMYTEQPVTDLYNEAGVKLCPPTFYSNLVYELGGQPIDRNRKLKDLLI